VLSRGPMVRGWRLVDQGAARRFHFVDLLRGLAALAVLICHYRWFFARYPGDWRTDIPLPGYSVLWPIYDHGEFAVYVFWTLSGFVFAIAYGQFGKGLSIRDFWLRRFSRLYPLHFATLLTMAALQTYSMARFGAWQVYGNNDVPHFILQTFLASNWFTMENSFNGPIWSVSIEELIYFAFLIYMSRAGLNLRLALALAGVGFVIERLTGNMVALCGSLFFAGVATSVLLPQVHGRMGRYTMLVSLIALMDATALFRLVGGAGVTVYLFPLAALWLFASFDLSLELNRRLRWIGAITYAVYLLHMPILVALRMAFGMVPIWLFVGLVIALAIPTYYLFEAPVQRWIRRRFPLQRRSFRRPLFGRL
jgi:peptidoglycan/LPS O-acetylase OafA/YrhL